MVLKVKYQLGKKELAVPKQLADTQYGQGCRKLGENQQPYRPAGSVREPAEDHAAKGQAQDESDQYKG